MRNLSIVFAVICFLLIPNIISGCVGQEEPLLFAQDHWSECTEHVVIAHRLAQVSQTEVQMDCGSGEITHTVKCIYGWGIISPTVCHENN